MITDYKVAIEILEWHTVKDCWFDKNNQYRTGIHTFSPSTRVEDALYVLSFINYWTIVGDPISGWSCSVYKDLYETKLTEYLGSDSELGLAICKAVLASGGNNAI